MAYIFAMSDIHGHIKGLEEALSLIDLSSDNVKRLILCGDYIDNGNDSCRVLYKVKELTESYPDKVVALMGNHEKMFLEFVNASDKDIWNTEWLSADSEFTTVNSFISQETKEAINTLYSQSAERYTFLFQAAKLIKNDILTNHASLIKWLRKLPFYYETEEQIFVHAGIDEEAEDYWMYGTSEDYYVSKYPATFGTFYKDIIAGHVSTSSIVGKRSFHDVYWDGKSHYYIDGSVNESGVVLLLRYDTDKKAYSEVKSVDGSVTERTIKKGRNSR